MKTYKCIKKCQWQGRLWHVGDIVTTAEKPPEHFVPAAVVEEKPAKVKAPKAEPAKEKPAKTEEAPQAAEQEAEEKFNLMAFKAKLRKLGIEATNKDSKETVLKRYEEYKQMVAEAEKAGIEVPEGATKDEVLALIGG